jgi:hypothetical protein
LTTGKIKAAGLDMAKVIAATVGMPRGNCPTVGPTDSLFRGRILKELIAILNNL